MRTYISIADRFGWSFQEIDELELYDLFLLIEVENEKNTNTIQNLPEGDWEELM